MLDLAALPSEFVVFDLETTGLDAAKHEIIEIGALLCRPVDARDGKLRVDTFQALVRPSRPIPAKITELTGITQAMVDSDGEDLPAVLERFRAFIGERRLVAFNADFDVRFLRATGVPVNNPVSCALKMAREAWPGRETYRLQALTASIKTTQQAHRALADCHKAMAVYMNAVQVLRRH